MEIEGKIIMDLPLQQGVSKAGNQWKKKEWVLETFGQYPRQVKFDFFGDRVDQNPLQVGQSYAISFDIESREYNGRWYTDIRGYASRPLEQGMPAAPQQPAYGAGFGAPAGPQFGAPAAPSQPSFSAESSPSDDLPF